MPVQILLVDDDYYFSELTAIRLGEAGYLVSLAKSLRELKEQLEIRRYDYVLLDLDLGAESGLDGLPSILEHSPTSTVIVFTGHGTISAAMEAIRRGASAFVEKSDDFEPLLKRLRGFKEKLPPPSRWICSI